MYKVVVEFDNQLDYILAATSKWPATVVDFTADNLQRCHRRSQEMQWVHVHPQGGEKNGGRNLQRNVVPDRARVNFTAGRRRFGGWKWLSG